MESIILGSVNIDETFYLKRFPAPGETLLAESHSSSLGGKGANQAFAYARLGGQGLFACSLGDDLAGEKAKKELQLSGLKVISKTSSLPTGRAFISVDSSSENTIIVSEGANADFDVSLVQRSFDKMSSRGFVLLQMEIPLDIISLSIRLAKEKGHMVILNPAPVKDIPLDLYSSIDFLTPNETELSKLSCSSCITLDEKIAVAKKMIKKGIHNIIVTLGSKGALLVNNGTSILVPGFKVKPIDTVGAGDCFNGSLLYALCHDYTLEDAISFACKAAAIAVTRKGAVPSMPTMKEVMAFNSSI